MPFLLPLRLNIKDPRNDHLDGLTIGYDAWWFNARASNTKPLMRFNLEANDEGTMEERKGEVLRVIRDADPLMTIKE